MSTVPISVRKAQGIATECPCGCGVVSLKGLSSKSGHVPNCGKKEYGAELVCRSCLSRRSKKKGQTAQAAMHRALGGQGFTPSNEETARPYTLQVMPESKAGGQIPAGFGAFLDTDWFRRALAQSERSVPVGAGVKPSVFLSVPRKGRWLVVKL